MTLKWFVRRIICLIRDHDLRYVSTFYPGMKDEEYPFGGTCLQCKRCLKHIKAGKRRGEFTDQDWKQLERYK